MKSEGDSSVQTCSRASRLEMKRAKKAEPTITTKELPQSTKM